MANILLVDSDKLACTAMRGIATRGGHRFAEVESVPDALKFIRRNVDVDIVFLELKLKGDNGLGLIRILKENCNLASIPVVVYAANADRQIVRQVLELGVQNFLVKPYSESHVKLEVAKACSEPWLKKFFEGGPSRLAADRRKAMLEKLHAALDKGRASLKDQPVATGKKLAPILDWLKRLSAVAEKGGAAGVVDSLSETARLASEGKWPAAEAKDDSVELLMRLIHCYLNPKEIPEGFLSDQDSESDKDSVSKKFWSKADSENRCPLIDMKQIERDLGRLSGCPVPESIVASFQMAANGHPTSLNPLLSLAEKDAGLTVQILIAANRLKKKTDDGSEPIEEPRMAVGLAGEIKLSGLGATLETVQERLFDCGPGMNWTSYRMFQLATARMSAFVCEYLEMPDLQSVAYTAGLINDFGRLLLIRLYPFAFQAIHSYARTQRVSLEQAELHFLGCSTREIAVRYAEKEGLPTRFVSVLRGIQLFGDESPDDQNLAAAVSLSRDLLRQNRVGWSGETPTDLADSLEETDEWRILSKRVYLNFDIKKFERLAHAECRSLKLELSPGLQTSRVA